jgi:hypothetical protein
MPKAPRDKASAAPKKQNRKTASNAGNGVSAETGSGVNGHNGNGVHTEAASVVLTPSAVTSPAVAMEPQVSPSVEEQIRARAFELYLERGGNGGSPEQDWLRAKEEISGQQRIA